MKQREIDKIMHIKNMEHWMFCIKKNIERHNIKIELHKNAIKKIEHRIDNLKFHIKLVKDNKDW